MDHSVAAEAPSAPADDEEPEDTDLIIELLQLYLHG